MINVNLEQMPLPPPSNYGSLISNTENSGRVRSMSPPPPPLPIEDSENGASNRRRVLMPIDADLPGWVPKDFIDKGKRHTVKIIVDDLKVYQPPVLQLWPSMITMLTRKMN